MDKDTTKMIEEAIKHEPKADKIVLGFIYDFLYHICDTDKDVELTRVKFRAGYCYYFAVMLKAAFNRGQIVWCAPYWHIAWQDENDVVYDIEGVNHSDCDYYIPVSYIEEGLKDFKRVPGEIFNASPEYIKDAILRYEKNLKG